MKRFLLILSFVAAAAGFAGCSNDNDDERLYDTLVGRVWAGDLGFYQEGKYPLDSYVYFAPDGFGTDELHYADNGEFVDRLTIQWSVDRYDDTLYISYGNVDAPRELRHARIRRGILSGDLYIGTRYYNYVELYMQ